ncbi:Chorion peroxidase-like 6 [Homarus americanus]|uniref:Chorion peroxidase-like 6 n=1 Tax=Homarus americanus TaxID=6706 RepID=A0A8J5JR76_HOMAM|nr:Chorion peroxidase-like 6 [Homarus americanus]
MSRWSWMVVAVVAALQRGGPLGAQGIPVEEMEELPVARVIRQISFPGGGQNGGFPGPGVSQGGFPSFGGSQGGCNCIPLVTCASVMTQITQQCRLGNGSPGVCCPASNLAAQTPARGQGDSKVFRNPNISVRMKPIDQGMLNAACNKGINHVNQVNQLEQNLLRNNKVVPRNSPASVHLRFFKTKESAKRMDQIATAIIAASSNMLRDFGLTSEQAGFGLRNIQVANTTLGRTCPPLPRCSVSSARSLNTNGSPLPNERHITNNILIDLDNPDQDFTLFVMQWAQFIDHDFAHVPFHSFPNNQGIECCENGHIVNPPPHPFCWPIDTTGDPFYGPKGSNCMNFVRSMFAVGAGEDCTFGYAEQLNQITHWIDGSTVYGSDEEEQRPLRTFRDGLLKISGNNLLPINPNQGGDCQAKERNSLCFLAGDSRVNEQPGLTAIHTVWMRQHNTVARQLRSINPQWSDEAVFQEARRIIVAQIQHITYNEWLPIIVGNNFMQSFGINVLQNGYSFDYNDNFNPSMNNEFSTAAFRFGHTLVQGTVRMISAAGGISTVRLRDHFDSLSVRERPDWMTSFIAIQQFDPFVSQELSNHLFQIVQTLSRIYNSVDDIDFFVGGLVEKKVSGGLLGWTFLCVVGDQFARLKKGDRYFYDLGGQPGSFNEGQLQEIRRTSWARILCDNSNIEAVQPLAFRQTNNAL